MRLRIAVWCGMLAAAVVSAGQIDGVVLVERPQVHHKFTIPLILYTRGGVLPPEPAQPVDPELLEFARTSVIIFLEGDLPVRPDAAVMKQRGKRFVPDLLAVSAGSTVSFPNLDPMFHNAFSISKPREFDIRDYPHDDARQVTFPKTGIVTIACHLHPPMAATIVVCPNAFHTQPDAGGRFAIADVPPGAYHIVAWRRDAGFVRQTVTVSENRPAEVRFMIPLASNP